jgi:hypothetical protein
MELVTKGFKIDVLPHDEPSERSMTVEIAQAVAASAELRLILGAAAIAVGERYSMRFRGEAI